MEAKPYNQLEISSNPFFSLGLDHIQEDHNVWEAMIFLVKEAVLLWR